MDALRDVLGMDGAAACRVRGFQPPPRDLVGSLAVALASKVGFVALMLRWDPA